MTLTFQQARKVWLDSPTDARGLVVTFLAQLSLGPAVDVLDEPRLHATIAAHEAALSMLLDTEVQQAENPLRDGQLRIAYDELVDEIDKLHKTTGRGNHGPIGNLRCVADAYLSVRIDRDEVVVERDRLEKECEELRQKLQEGLETLHDVSRWPDERLAELQERRSSYDAFDVASLAREVRRLRGGSPGP